MTERREIITTRTKMENSSLWQGAILCGILFWLLSSSYLNLTLKLRSFLQPFVTHYVQSGTPILLQIQVTENRAPNNFILSKISYFRCFSCKCWLFFCFWIFGLCRVTGLDILMLFFLGCLVLFLFHFTLLLYLCYSGYV